MGFCLGPFRADPGRHCVDKVYLSGVLGGIPGADVWQIAADSCERRHLRNFLDPLHRALLLHRAEAGAGADLQRRVGISPAVDLEFNPDRGFRGARLGYNQGLEAAEFPLLIDIIIWIALLAITAQLLVTVARRKESGLYVSLWYLIAAMVWMDINWPFGNFIIPYAIPGINNAALHGLYIHYIVGLWITPAGYVLIYYFLPASVRTPIYSHKLSLIGFWSLALFYPFVGIHHYLYSPIADWAETISIVMSVLLIVPVWTVLQNFFGTMMGRWQGFGSNLTAKFLITGSLMYLIGCFRDRPRRCAPCSGRLILPTSLSLTHI